MKFLVQWNLEGDIAGCEKKSHAAGEFIEVEPDKVKHLVDKQYGGDEKDGAGVLVPVTDQIDVTDGKDAPVKEVVKDPLA